MSDAPKVPATCACGHPAIIGNPPTEEAPHYVRPDGVWCVLCRADESCPEPDASERWPRAFLSAVSAPPPDPQGWEEIERLVKAYGQAAADANDAAHRSPYGLVPEEAGIAEDAALAALLRALRASVSGAPGDSGDKPSACGNCSRRLESDFRWCPHCGAMSPRERIRRGWNPLVPSPSGPGGAAGGDVGDEEPRCAACGRRASDRVHAFVDSGHGFVGKAPAAPAPAGEGTKTP